MTTLPKELADARLARTEAWNEYMQVIEREHTPQEFHDALHKAGKADELVTRWYHRWQAVGGTSDIESIEDAELAAEKRKALRIVMDVASTPKQPRYILSRSWADKHLNSDDDLKYFKGGAIIR